MLRSELAYILRLFPFSGSLCNILLSFRPGLYIEAPGLGRLGAATSRIGFLAFQAGTEYQAINSILNFLDT